MMWDYIQLPDEAQIAYSDIREDGTVLVGVERPRDGGGLTPPAVFSLLNVGAISMALVQRR